MLEPGRRRLARETRQRGDDGYSPVEAAIVFPVLLFVVFLVVQYALLWHGRHVAEAAAQGALRTARGYQSTAALGEQDARSYLAQVSPRLLLQPQVQVDRTATTVTVRVRADVLSIVGTRLSVEETAVGPVERYVGPG